VSHCTVISKRSEAASSLQHAHSQHVPACDHKEKLIQPLTYSNISTDLLKSEVISCDNGELQTNISHISFTSIIKVNDHAAF
jgi:hypothetical protein